MWTIVYAMLLLYEKLIRLTHFLSAYICEQLEQEEKSNRCFIN